MEEHGQMKVAIAGGGTGGHIYPAIAVVECLRAADASLDVVFVGTRRGLERGIVPSLGYRMRHIAARPLPSKKDARLVAAALYALVGLVQSFWVLLAERPSVVVGTGGYASGPLVFAAMLAGVPTLLIEPNVIPGRTTMMLAGFVDRIALGFQESVKYFRKGTNLRVTGVPVRSTLLAPRREDGIKRFGLDQGRRTVLVFGGSRGAHSINRAIIDCARLLRARRDLQFVVQTGEADYQEVVRALGEADVSFRAYPYLDDIGYAYRASDLVVCRAGASTITELAAFGLPAILIPYPHATLSHQEENARLLVAAGAALVIADKDLTGEVLASAIVGIIFDSAASESMSRNSGDLGKPDASREVSAMVVDLAKRRGRMSRLATVLGDICSAR
jgi:UDP-N-acetylglucosamine--N-acetylmuramyl-(pentapeptide) pyrophosphoryl-undecaprenol N-acetylglucosamine transferase